MALTGAQITTIADWGERASDTIDQQIARQEAARLAAAVKDADRHLHRTKSQLKDSSSNSPRDPRPARAFGRSAEHGRVAGYVASLH